ncbi:hypothetical protein J5N97_003516 [Dioscorea zingiberensis]|uniref:Uncharacterized protein n=1 Tax=Dioscorea zingiberensis TaxID=325984 RepID=A0A9D5D4A2_9LILI|nr:hypothetical protein J5N97_003516 [Dioscorea zingiberensis]
MARILSRYPIGETLSRSPASRILAVRRRSGRSEKTGAMAQLLEIDLEADGVAASGSEVEVLGMRRLEDAIHGIIVRRSAPDWLPFRPGSSYWVPPKKRSLGLVQLVGKLANPMTEEESLSFTSVRGWPSFAYFVEGVPPRHARKTIKRVVVQSDDEEG